MNKPKLVRDKIPKIIEAKGEHPEWRRVENQFEHRERLALKLSEELNEYLVSKTQPERIEELADVSEVIHSFTVVDDYLDEHLEMVRLRQRARAGETDIGTSDDVIDRFTALRGELSATPSSSERLEKLAGLLQCVHDFAAIDNVKPDDVETIRIQKKEKRGSFIGGIVLLNW